MNPNVRFLSLTAASLSIAILAPLGVVAIVASLAAPAASYPLPQVQISRGATSRVRPLPVGAQRHNVFGTIVRLTLPKFTLRTRSGRLVVVDATTAIGNGTYSAPLFSGKLVVIGGAYDAQHVLHAVTITRMPTLDRTTPPDN
jgi:hypothetical protein